MKFSMIKGWDIECVVANYQNIEQIISNSDIKINSILLPFVKAFIVLLIVNDYKKLFTKNILEYECILWIKKWNKNIRLR